MQLQVSVVSGSAYRMRCFSTILFTGFSLQWKSVASKSKHNYTNKNTINILLDTNDKRKEMFMYNSLT